MKSRQLVYRDKKKSGRLSVTAWIFCILAFLLTCLIGYMYFVPSYSHQPLHFQSEHPIYVNGNMQEQGAIIVDNHVKLPLPVLDELLVDSPIYYEEETSTIVLTTVDQVLRFETESLNALMNEKSYELTIAADVIDGIVYIPSELIQQLYDIQTVQSAETGIVMLYQGGEQIDTVTIKRDKGTYLRQSPSIKSPYIEQLAVNEQVMVWGKEENWLLVQTADGWQGYIQESHTQYAEPIVYESTKEPTGEFNNDLSEMKINLTWEAIYNKQPDLKEMPAMEGLNVVSPTWFELLDDTGKIQGKATHEYVEWAHKRGYQVWAVFSNGFEPEQTTEVLSSVEKRFYMIQQLMAFAKLYQIDGINIDFENVYTKDSANFVQFVKELTPIMHELGIIVSVDVTPKSNSEMWSLFLDREALSSASDYLILMAYDEHWGSSPRAGSVASLPWVENAIVRILEEDKVPSNKLILGMPLYTRIWSEGTEEDGTVKVSSKAVGMKRIEEILAEKKLEPQLDENRGQNYVEYTENGIKQRIWLEDELSITSRVELVNKYNLAGVATWQRAFQKDSIWKTIEQSLNKSY